MQPSAAATNDSPLAPVLYAAIATEILRNEPNGIAHQNTGNEPKPLREPRLCQTKPFPKSDTPAENRASRAPRPRKNLRPAYEAEGLAQPNAAFSQFP